MKVKNDKCLLVYWALCTSAHCTQEKTNYCSHLLILSKSFHDIMPGMRQTATLCVLLCILFYYFIIILFHLCVNASSQSITDMFSDFIFNLWVQCTSERMYASLMVLYLLAVSWCMMMYVYICYYICSRIARMINRSRSVLNLIKWLRT